MKPKIATTLLMISLLCTTAVFAQYPVIKGIPAGVDFSDHVRTWDGFGFNYVQTAHTYDYKKYPQEYGGFSLLNDQQKSEIIDLVFGEDGLKVGLLKMFLDPLHQSKPGGKFNHTLSAAYEIEFAVKGYQKAKEYDADLSIITTLYGPPGWTTLQKFNQGRDLDPKMKMALADYMIEWARYLKQDKGLPVHYISLHNEGDDWMRWAWDGKRKGIFDYNMYWPHEQINDFLKFMPGQIAKAGLKDVKVTNGEPLNWYAFSRWGHALAIYKDKEALSNLGLITSHGFYSEFSSGKWYGNHNSDGIDLLRSERPDLHAWVTSTSWGKMDAKFIWEIANNIYLTKVNGIIPWAGIQRPKEWEGGDPNMGCAIRVHEDSTYSVEKGYYFYKQVSVAGQPGMAVARTYAEDSQTSIIGFAANGTNHSDAFVIINTSPKDVRVIDLSVEGTDATRFHAYRTSSGDEDYKDLGIFELDQGKLIYKAPIGTVTTFYAVE